jgi:hypothetical protein
MNRKKQDVNLLSLIVIINCGIGGSILLGNAIGTLIGIIFGVIICLMTIRSENYYGNNFC